MSILEKLNTEMKGAMKDKNETTVSVIRMLKADIANTAIRSNKENLTDAEILQVIQRHIKQHNDSIEQFKKGNRDDLVAKEEKELNVLKTYIPEQMADGELEKLIKEIITAIGQVTKKDMGKVIKETLEKTNGKADGKRISALAAKLIS